MLEICSHLQGLFFPPLLGERAASPIEDQLRWLVCVWGLHLPLNTSVTLTPARCLSSEAAWALTMPEGHSALTALTWFTQGVHSLDRWHCHGIYCYFSYCFLFH